MVKRIRRTSDCKTEVEASLRALGYDTNPVEQSQLHNKECVVRYSNVSSGIFTQEEYDFVVYIDIEINVDNNNEIPYVVMEIMKNVTHDVENSVVPWCTSFYFEDPVITPLGTSTNIVLRGRYEPIIDWVEDI